MERKKNNFRFRKSKVDSKNLPQIMSVHNPWKYQFSKLSFWHNDISWKQALDSKMCRPALRVHSDEGNGFVVYESLPDGVVLEVVEGDRDEVVQLGAVLN